MKVTQFGPAGLPVALGGWSSGVTSISSNATVIGGLTAQNFVQRITSNSSNTLLNPIVNFAAGTGVSLAAASNTITINSTVTAAGNIVSSNGSNSLAAIVNLQAGTGIALSVSGQTITVVNTGVPGPTGVGPGTELDYVQVTATTTVTATTEAGADTIVTGNAVTYDGSTAIMIEFFATYIQSATNGTFPRLWLYDNGSSIGRWGIGLFVTNSPSTMNNLYTSIRLSRRLTPSAAAHTYSVRAAQSGAASSVVSGGAGGSGNDQPTFIRITKVA